MEVCSGIMEARACLNCNLFFKPRRKSNVYCCRTCQMTHLKATGKIKNRPRLGATLECQYCSNEFYVPQYRIKTAKYCSPRCTSLANPQNTLKAQENSPIAKRAQAKNTKSSSKNYKTIKVDGKWVREHRWLMEQHLGRKLEKWEQVHHIDGNYLNNDLSNLEVLSNSDHQKKELKPWMD